MHFKDILPLLALASAAPLLDPRALIIKTVTDEIIVTITDYTTLWVTPGSKPTASAGNPVPTNTATATGAIPPVLSSVVAPLPSSSMVATSSSAVVVPPPAQTTAITATPPSPPPMETTTTTSSTSSTSVVVPVPTTIVTSTASSPQPTIPAGGGGIYPVETLLDATSPDGPCTSDTKCGGDITHFNPSMGVGACGYRDWNTKSIWKDEDLVVAVSSNIMGSFTNIDANNINTLCKRSVKIKAQAGGQDVVARVVDRCGTCPGNFDLDLSPAAFTLVAPQGDGRVHNVQWEWV